MQCFYNTIIGNVTDTDTETVTVERCEVHIMRTSGILLPVASLPSKYGIGAFSKEAYEFVDTLEKAGQSYWQILPLGPTGYGDSPYQSFSTFAGNPYFIDLEKLIKKGWITKDECKAYDFGDNAGYVDYEKIYNCRYEILRKAYERSRIADDADFQKFCKKNKEWLDDYALYTEIKAANGGKSWSEWEDEYRLRDELALEKFAKENQEGLLFQKFMQYEFATQWSALKAYANEKGIEIIGDIPIYVAFDSADSWSHPELFQFDENGLPTGVAGCPPDAFSATGQLWGNPLYKWEYHKETGYAWWMKRIRHCVELYDVIRIDHFRGFDEYYSIPYGSNYLPHNYDKNCVVYTGTHDNETLAGWYRELKKEDKKFALRYMGRKKLSINEAVWEIIRLAQSSVADTCIIPIQDYLCLGNEARINHPSTLGGNWIWRLHKDEISKKLVKKIRRMTELYCRIPEKTEMTLKAEDAEDLGEEKK